MHDQTEHPFLVGIYDFRIVLIIATRKLSTRKICKVLAHSLYLLLSSNIFIKLKIKFSIAHLSSILLKIIFS